VSDVREGEYLVWDGTDPNQASLEPNTDLQQLTVRTAELSIYGRHNGRTEMNGMPAANNGGAFGSRV
jgi:hypothetical protein